MPALHTTMVLRIGSIAIIWSVVCFALAVYCYQRVLSLQQVTDTNIRACVACNLLLDTVTESEVSSPLLKSLNRNSKDGVDSCCAENADQLSALLKFIHEHQTRKIEPVTFDVKNVFKGPVSVHRQLLPPGNVHNSPKESNSHLIVDDINRTLSGGVEVLSSGYHILIPGIYHVYSNVEFVEQSCKQCTDQTWRHNVVRYRPNQRYSSGVLLSSIHTRCDDSEKDRETSYTGGMFFLEAGDHLHVEVSGGVTISYNIQANYFGLVRMGDLNS